MNGEYMLDDLYFRDSNFSCKHDYNQYDLLYVVQTEYPLFKMLATRTMSTVFWCLFNIGAFP